jgi:hypothetical protein
MGEVKAKMSRGLPSEEMTPGPLSFLDSVMNPAEPEGLFEYYAGLGLDILADRYRLFVRLSIS